MVKCKICGNKVGAFPPLCDLCKAKVYEIKKEIDRLQKILKLYES